MRDIKTLLKIRNLNVEYQTRTEKKSALSNSNLDLNEGEILGLLGESGAGKSTVGMAILKLIEPPNKTNGEIWFNDLEILSLKGSKLRNYRWNNVSMIFQAAMNILDPVINIKDSFSQLLIDKKISSSKREDEKYGAQLLRLVGLTDSVQRMYPFELSGGMKQRVVIAMAIATNPSIVIADEITTALDTLTQFNILMLLQDLMKEGKIGGLILISHDLSVQLMMSDRIIVMYRGYAIEEGTANDIFYNPLHPYTQILINSRNPVKNGVELAAMPKSFDSIGDSHCIFVVSCKFAKGRCYTNKPELLDLGETHKVMCFLYGEDS